MRILLFSCLLVSALARNHHNYFWRNFKDTVPNDAYIFEGLCIAQVGLLGLVPGTLYPEKKQFVTLWFGFKIFRTSGIKILCDEHTENFSWEHVNINNLDNKELENYVIGGEEFGETLYIGKVYHQGEWKIGKVFPPKSGLKGLRVWHNNGLSYVVEDFEMLKYKTQDANNSSIIDIRMGS